VKIEKATYEDLPRILALQKLAEEDPTFRTYTDEGNVILDNCVGSGTTAVAAEKLNRRWLAIEKEPEYCAITKRRLEELGKNHGG